ncbi:hypothetical protein SLEP1_g38950 [Rubroshorea leprosula]|uniref:Pectate lyase domain-containing protein n=1 Tax=Rubroshorea leprosula TaxID=152421 RepID=A0AAV5KZ93_9ROSI|nr:hypothetical protein SLEP1_g38950 [Rubroshorea leprosula]
MVPSLPYAHVDSSLRALAGQAEAFGRFAIGGLHGPLYPVTTLALDEVKDGILDMYMGRDKIADTVDLKGLMSSCAKTGMRIITLEMIGQDHCVMVVGKKSPSGLSLKFQELFIFHCTRVSSYKTIDGCGQRVKLTGKGLSLKECEHVIICNLEFEGGKGPDADGIQIKPKSKHIWIDHCGLRAYDNGLIDITRESTDITISRCHFSQHDKTILTGPDPSHIGDRCIRIIIQHCFFDRTRERHPRVRYGKVHLYNNYTRNWGTYAVCASVE